MRKGFALLIILALSVSSLIMVKPVFAQIPTPPVPEFTLQLVENPYDVQPIYSTNPYTGANITVQAGYHVENKTIVITIKNQPYSYTYNSSDWWLVYDVQAKGHFEEYWGDLTPYTLPVQSNSEFTVVSVPADNYPDGGQVDFQVQALIEYQTQHIAYPHFPSLADPYNVTTNETGAPSGWSNTQTLTIPTSTVPEFPSTILIITFLVTATLLGNSCD